MNCNHDELKRAVGQPHVDDKVKPNVIAYLEFDWEVGASSVEIKCSECGRHVSFPAFDLPSWLRDEIEIVAKTTASEIGEDYKSFLPNFERLN